MKQKQFPLRIDEDIFKDIRKESKDIGISMNKIINLKLKGKRIMDE